MVDQQLVNYIRAEQARGYDEETLRKYLIKLGHDPLNVNEAITIVRKQKEILQPFPQPPETRALNLTFPSPF